MSDKFTKNLAKMSAELGSAPMIFKNQRAVLKAVINKGWALQKTWEKLIWVYGFLCLFAVPFLIILLVLNVK